jgi:hypothetical protein
MARSRGGGIRYEMDSSDLTRLIIDLSEAPLRAQLRTRKTMQRQVGPKLRAEMAVDAAGHLGNWFGIPGTSYVTPLPPHVSFEMIGTFEVEAGIEAKGAGKLGGIIAKGSVNNAPAYDYRAGLRRTLPFAEKWLAETAQESVLGDDGRGRR